MSYGIGTEPLATRRSMFAQDEPWDRLLAEEANVSC